ncbi:hypothetical protein [Herbaspirillum rubrisubalbicans]|uniref:hypothetical protein n=1 Tax=Herbaspirillum rubrisubalbicans TaxID=80842 RepID=UPI001D93B474|nr:hypothetical protein [Herbaspirillum rubrisubalbicans]
MTTASNVNDVDKLREAMRNSKGAGNFPNLFVQAQFLSLNEWAGQEMIRFRSYQLPTNEG